MLIIFVYHCSLVSKLAKKAHLIIRAPDAPDAPDKNDFL